MSPVCVECRVFFRRSHNGVSFIEGMPMASRTGDLKDRPPAKAGTEHWGPYKLWAADEFQCPGCGTKILSGYAARPMAEHYEPTFSAAVEEAGPYIMVNDCA